jgi:hypothetical protein
VAFWPAIRQITWDPYLIAEGINSDGSIYKLSPIIALAHELIHAAHPDDPAYQAHDSEPLVRPIENQIAAELNASLGKSYTMRDTHERRRLYYTDSSTSDSYYLWFDRAVIERIGR